MLKGFMPVLLGLTLLASPAFAAKAARHCVDKDNKEITLTSVAGSTRSAQCKAGGREVDEGESREHGDDADHHACNSDNTQEVGPRHGSGSRHRLAPRIHRSRSLRDPQQPVLPLSPPADYIASVRMP
jgi:hypothetical protein